MISKTTLSQYLINYWNGFHSRNFFKNLNNLENSQLNVLKNSIQNLESIGRIPKGSISSYESLTQFTSVNSYNNHIDFFNNLKSNPISSKNVVRWQPTSGSTHKEKWFPYTRPLLNEFDRALSPWMWNLAKQNPQILKGTHYWSLSWLPNHLRSNQMNLDDTELFPWYKKLLLKSTMTLSERVDLAETSDSSLFATACYLVADQNFAFASVWSPTYWLSLFEFIVINQNEIAQSLLRGRWQIYQKELNHLPCPKSPKQGDALIQSELTLNGENDLKKLWSKFMMISCWTTGQSKIYSENLKNLFPDISISKKGLWATEGVVTIPINENETLSYLSHFYEFEDIESKKIIPSWKLQVDQVVAPLLTTSAGLLRYKLEDQMKVTGFYGEVPQLTFLNRDQTVDLVGEKLSFSDLEDILNQTKIWLKDILSNTNELLPCCFITKTDTKKLQYVMIINGDNENSTPITQITTEKISNFVESKMCEYFHYKLARELKQLLPVQVVVIKNAWQIVQNYLVNDGMLKGNIKPQPIYKIKSNTNELFL